MDITFAKPSYPSVGGFITLATENAGLTVTALRLDRKMRGALKRAMEAEKFTGKNGQLLVILAPSGLRADRVILVGVGKGAQGGGCFAQAIRLMGKLEQCARVTSCNGLAHARPPC